MARIAYVSRNTMPEGRTDLYDQLVAERGPNLEHIFLALANAPDLTEAVLGMAMALRKKTTLSRIFRELAVYGLFVDEAAYPGDLDALLAEGPDAFRAAVEALYAGTRIDLDAASSATGNGWSCC